MFSRQATGLFGLIWLLVILAVVLYLIGTEIYKYLPILVQPIFAVIYFLLCIRIITVIGKKMYHEIV